MKDVTKEVSFVAGGNVGIGLAAGEIMGAMIVGGCTGALGAIFTCAVLSSRVEPKPFVLGGVIGMALGAVFALTVPTAAEHLEKSLNDALTSTKATGNNTAPHELIVKTDRILLLK